jgi:hypothetical protein
MASAVKANQGNTMMKNIFVSCALLLAACTEQFPKELPAPVVPPSVMPPQPSGTPLRTVEQRSIFGVSKVTNLMADGDFEFTGRSQQMPWIVFGSQAGQGRLNYETGGRCVSGIRCAVLTKTDQIIGWFSSPPSGTFTVSVFIYPGSTGACKGLGSIAAIDINDQNRGFNLAAASMAPDEKGWCTFAATGAAIPGGESALYIESNTDGLRIDNAVVTSESTMPKGISPSRIPTGTAVSIELKQKVKVIAEQLRKTRIYGIQKTPSLDNPPESLLRNRGN